MHATRITLGLLLTSGIALAGEPGAAGPPPNLLFLVLDDVGVDKLKAYTSSAKTTTPTLDLLAETGLRFTRAYAEPECSPTRAAILTGRLSGTTGVTAGFPWLLTEPDTHVLDPAPYHTLPAVLRRRDYRAFAVGKWHLTSQNWQPDPYLHPLELGFESHHGPITNFVNGTGETYDSYTLNVATDGRATQTLENTYATTRQVDDALARMDDAGTRPWFLWLGFTAPHAPWSPPPQQLVSVDVNTLGQDEKLYDATLEALDTEIGRLLASMRPATLQRTIVFVFGDNGTPPGAWSPPQTMLKGSVHEGGVHIPLLVWSPLIAAGSTDQLTHVVDLYSTALALAGVEAPTHDGFDLSALLAGGAPAEPARTHVLCARNKPIGHGPYDVSLRMIRNDTHKLMRVLGKPEELRRFNGTPNGKKLNPPYTGADLAAYEDLAEQFLIQVGR